MRNKYEKNNIITHELNYPWWIIVEVVCKHIYNNYSTDEGSNLISIRRSEISIGKLNGVVSPCAHTYRISQYLQAVLQWQIHRWISNWFYPRAQGGNLLGDSIDSRILINFWKVGDLEYRTSVNKLRDLSFFSWRENIFATAKSGAKFSITKISHVKTTTTFPLTSLPTKN